MDKSSDWTRPREMKAKVLALFNHKGGVSKTTTTFNLGAMLANKGMKVLMVDADPQCNLTGLALRLSEYDDLFSFYNKKDSTNIYDILAGTFGFANSKIDIKNGVSVSDTYNERLKILAGHIDFAKFDLQIATALTSSETIPVLKPLIGSLNEMIRKTAEKHDFDVVIIDMSPSISAINMCILMAADNFLLPTSPDFFCYQAINSLRDVLPDWADKLAGFKDGIVLPRHNPKMLGVISQNYRVYDKTGDETEEMTKEFKQWRDKIRTLTNEKFVPALEKVEMVVSSDHFKSFVNYDSPYNIANIQNFNSLVPASQSRFKPFFELNKTDVNWSGAVWNGVEVNIKKSRDIYSRFADSVLGMMGYER